MEHNKVNTVIPRNTDNIFYRFTENVVFSSRWILAPLYAGLILGMIIYVMRFFVELWELTSHFMSLNGSETMLMLLGLVDITMVANLITMIIIGSYSTFVRKINFEELANRPQGFSKLTAGKLKVKMGMSLIGVSSIHLLKVFTEMLAMISGERNAHIAFAWPPIVVAMIIHVLFIFSTITMVLVDNAMHSDAHNHDDNHNEAV